MRSYLSPIDLHINKISFCKALKSKASGKEHTIRGLRPKLRRDRDHGNESRNFGIFKEISGFLGSSLGICTKFQLATLLLSYGSYSIPIHRASVSHLKMMKKVKQQLWFTDKPLSHKTHICVFKKIK